MKTDGRVLRRSAVIGAPFLSAMNLAHTLPEADAKIASASLDIIAEKL